MLDRPRKQVNRIRKAAKRSVERSAAGGRTLYLAPVVRQILTLFARDRDRIQTIGRAASSALRIHESMQKKPLAGIGTVADALKLSIPTVTVALNRLVRLGIAKEVTGKRRARLFGYSRYLNTLKEQNRFRSRGGCLSPTDSVASRTLTLTNSSGSGTRTGQSRTLFDDVRTAFRNSRPPRTPPPLPTRCLQPEGRASGSIRYHPRSRARTDPCRPRMVLRTRAPVSPWTC